MPKKRRYVSGVKVKFFYIIFFAFSVCVILFCLLNITKKINMDIGPKYIIRTVSDTSGVVASEINLEFDNKKMLAKMVDGILGGDFSNPAVLAAGVSANLSTYVNSNNTNDAVLVNASVSPTPMQTSSPTPTPQAASVTYVEKNVPSNSGKVDMGNGVTILNETKYDIFKVDLSKPFTIKGEPKVLIVNSHTTESYAPSKMFNFVQTSSDRTTDGNYNMLKVGAELQKELTKLGVKTIQDKTLNDYPNYNNSYANSLKVVKEEMKNNSNIQIIIDLHRDAISNLANEKTKLVNVINGEKVAQVMVVVGTDELGLKHDTWNKNLAFAIMLQKNLLKVDADFPRPMNLRGARFNGNASPGAIIIEVGSSGNSLEEALASTKYIAQAVSKTVAQLK